MYGNANANIPQQAAEVQPGVSGTPLGSGVFAGSSVAGLFYSLKGVDLQAFEAKKSGD